jgi:hypothetical protein
MPIRPENAGRYPPDWERRSFFVRFVRGKGRCEWCGADHNSSCFSMYVVEVQEGSEEEGCATYHLG